MKKPSLKACAATVAALLLGGIAAAGVQTAAAARAGDSSNNDARAMLLDALQNDPGVPKVEPAGYDATIVVFSDYQCPYCHQIHPRLEALLREDKKLRIVYRDWPIFGAVSKEAARAAMASRYQGKHAAFNDALLNTKGRLTSEGIRQAAVSAGVDWNRLQADLVKHGAEIDGAIARTGHYAGLIGLSGTPALIVDSYLLPGAVSVETLREAVQHARKNQAARAAEQI
ncbi:DsbA family protein [Novosphingobium terrae]|uniref:DsbA family protein n=1 Tax=Novosphingobium terrae TaxID=2726189 RepID=UPI001F12DB5D|nr:DsbA family protein [Novosphingobium terrae]